MTQPAPYQENPDFVPDPTLVSGTLDTSQTGGGKHDSLSGITRVFHHAEEVFHHLAERRAERGHPQPGDAVEPLEAPGEPAEATAAPVAGQGPEEAVQTVQEPVAAPGADGSATQDEQQEDTAPEEAPTAQAPKAAGK